ncbi:MAG: transposase [Methanobrevibacter sp.]|jgi:hypothetical protein|nr:transposase [Candidatus Methanoflexus mossambicus]
MKVSLHYDKNDFKCILLSNILKVFDSRKTQQILAQYKVTPINRVVNILKTVMIALYYDTEISYVVNELNRDNRLLKAYGIDNVFNRKQISEFFSRFNDEIFYEVVIEVLNSINMKNNRGIRTIIVDGTDIRIDLNWFGRHVSKKKLENKPYKWGYSKSKGYYIGLKLTHVFDCKTMQPLAMLMHERTPNDAKIFDEIVQELKKRRILRKGDQIFFDRGYFSAKNYQMAITKYKFVPLIFPRGKNPENKIDDTISYTLDCFHKGNNDKSLFLSLKTQAMKKLRKWKEYKGIRSKIEDLNKLLKKCFALNKIHNYTKQSINKYTFLNVFLSGIVTSLDYRTKKDLQILAEM